MVDLIKKYGFIFTEILRVFGRILYRVLRKQQFHSSPLGVSLLPSLSLEIPFTRRYRRASGSPGLSKHVTTNAYFMFMALLFYLVSIVGFAKKHIF